MLAAPLGRFVELPREAGLGGIRAGAVGNPGFGIPWTVKLTGKFFEISLQFSKIPSHTIIM